MKSILELTGRADVHNPVVMETDEDIHKQVQEAAVQARTTKTHVNLQVTDWVATQQEDPVLKATTDWIPNWKVQNLKHLLGDDMNTKERMAVLQEQKRLMLYQGALYHCHSPAGGLEEVLWFVVPTAH